MSRGENGMTMFSTEMAKCRKCGQKQVYEKVLSWNSWLGCPPINTCWRCGKELNYDDIDLNDCSPQHRNEVRNQKIYERLSSKEKVEDNGKELVCSKCGSKNISSGSTIGIKLPNKYKYEVGYQVNKNFVTCNECGHEEYETLEELLACGLYEFIENSNEEEHAYVVKRVDNFQEIMDEWDRQRKEELEQIENELISEGLITTREEEQEYVTLYEYRRNNIFRIEKRIK